MTNYISKNNLQQYSTEVTAKYKKLFIPSNEVYAEDKVPYLFKATGDGSEMGTRMTDKVVGGTVAWNQLVNPDNYANVTTSGYVSNGITFTKQSDGSILANGTSEGGSSTGILLTLYAIAGHKYLLRGCPSGGGTTTYGFGSGAIATGSREHGNGAIFTYGTGSIGLTFAVADGVTVNNIVIKPQVFDLTQTLGSTIADHVYNLELTTAGAGVAWFKHYFPKDYYAYSAGELMSVKAGSHNTIGFNQWDEEWEVGSIDSNGNNTASSDRIRSKNYISVLQNVAYYIQHPNAELVLYFYDINTNFISSLDTYPYNVGKLFTTPYNCYYVRFRHQATTYNHDICINISNIDKNGTYEPYIKHTYPLDNNLELRGIPKLDSDNKLYYDGDLYESSGKVTRRYGIVDLGTLLWLYNTDSASYPFFTADLSNGPRSNVFGGICAKYECIAGPYTVLVNDKMCGLYSSTQYSFSRIVVRDSAYTDAVTFKAAMSGVYLVYELATATSETADPYVNPQVISSFGTEEYIDYAYAAGTRDVAIPVGHDSIYADAFLEKLENAPDNPYKDGDFIVNSKDGFNSYTELDPWLEENGYSKTTALLDTTLSVAGKAADAKAVGDAITAEEERAEDTYAKQKGSYPDLSSGQLLSTVELQDKVPYNFRTAGGSADIGIDLTEKVVGGTVAWNQLIYNGNFENTDRWTTTGGTVLTVANNVASVHRDNGTEIQAQIYSQNPAKSIIGHRYLFSATVQTINGLLIMLPTGTGSEGASGEYISYPTKTKISFIWTAGVSTDILSVVRGYTGNGVTSAIDFTVENYTCIDLTAMLGSTIADYLYSLEQATAGAGVAWFRNLFPKPYYAYNAGSLESVKVGSHDTVEFNQWDEEYNFKGINQTTGAEAAYTDRITSKNFIPALPNTNYYFKGSTSALFYVDCYDVNYVFLGKAIDAISHGYVQNETFTTLPNTRYIKFAATGSAYGTTYNHDICINLHWDGERDGEYEPYVKHAYALDNSLELRGIPKLNANNDLYYDGDEYESDGTVTRRYGIVDLGTLTYAYVSQSGVFYLMPNSIPSDFGGTRNARCSAYIIQPSITSADSIPDKAIEIRDASTVYLRNNAYTDPAALKAAMSGVYLVYELATPTTESATPYTNPQKVSNWGTEQYVDYAYEAGTRDMEIPVGHDSFYTNDLRAKVEMAPNSPDGDGYYIVHQHNGINRYTSPDDIALTEAEYQEIYNTLISGNA